MSSSMNNKIDPYDNPVVKKHLTTEEIQYLKANYLNIFFGADHKARSILAKIPMQEMADYEIAEKDANTKATELKTKKGSK